MSAIHSLKTWPESFAAVQDGRKRYEIRRNDRAFAVGDVLVLREWEPSTERYTREMVSVRVTYLTPGGTFGLPTDLCVMGIEPSDSWRSP